MRAWSYPESVSAELIANGASFYAFAGAGTVAIIGGHGLARAWSLFGKPQVVEFCRFQYVLRDPASGAIVTAGMTIDSDEPAFVFGGKSDATAAIDALEQELNAAQPAKCSLDLACDGYDLTLGVRAGKPFLKVRVDS